MAFDDDLNACAAIVQKGDPWRFRTVMAAPVTVREKLFPLYAFNVEVSRAPWVTAEPMIAEMRLQWWRDVLEEIAGDAPVRRHEVATPLACVLSVQQAKGLDQLIAVRRWDCYKDPFEDASHLERYLRQTSGALMHTAAEILGASRGAAEAGFGLGIASWMMAVPALEAQKRVPLVDGSPEGIAALAKDGVAALKTARSLHSDRSATPAFWPASGAVQILNAAVSQPGRVASGTLPEPSILKFAIKAALGRW